MSERRLIELPLASLHAHPDQPRMGLATETILSALEAIASNGNRFPEHMAVTVRTRQAGGYEILSGHHRVEAARRAEVDVVWAFVDEMDDRAAAMFLAASNSHTEMKPFEHGRHALMLRERHDISFAEYGRSVGRSASWVIQCANAYTVLEQHGGADHPYSELPFAALAAASRINSKTKREAVLTEMMGHGNPAKIAATLCNMVERGDKPDVALRKIEYEEAVQRDSAEGKHARPDLCGMAYYTEYLAACVEGIATMLAVRAEEIGANDTTEPPPVTFVDRVLARVYAERGRSPFPSRSEIPFKRPAPSW